MSTPAVCVQLAGAVVCLPPRGIIRRLITACPSRWGVDGRHTFWIDVAHLEPAGPDESDLRGRIEVVPILAAALYESGVIPPSTPGAMCANDLITELAARGYEITITPQRDGKAVQG